MKQHLKDWALGLFAVLLLSLDTGCASAPESQGEDILPSEAEPVEMPEVIAQETFSLDERITVASARDGVMYYGDQPVDEMVQKLRDGALVEPPPRPVADRKLAMLERLGDAGVERVFDLPLNEMVDKLFEQEAQQPVDKMLRHNNGLGQGSQGAYGSCGAVPSDSCRLMLSDLSVWGWLPPSGSTTYIHGGAETTGIEMELGVAAWGGWAEWVNTTSIGSSDLSYGLIQGSDFEMICTSTMWVVQQHSQGNYSSYTTCEKWLIGYSDRKPTESLADYNFRLFLTGAIGAGYAFGLKPTACGGLMTHSIYSSNYPPFACSQQYQILSNFKPWYSPYGYAYFSSLPPGL